MKHQYLIGGVPTAGKSTIARQLARELQVPWISTDQIRDILMMAADRDKYPDLCILDRWTPETFLSQNTAGEIVDIVNRWSNAVWPFLEQFIREQSDWSEGYIIEGTDIMPRFLTHSFLRETGCRAVFLVNHDQQQVHRTVYERGLITAAHKYSDDLKSREVEWVQHLTQQCEQEAHEAKMPLYYTRHTHQEYEHVFAILTDNSGDVFGN